MSDETCIIPIFTSLIYSRVPMSNADPIERLTCSSGCPYQPHLTMKYLYEIPKFLPWSCARGTCQSCGPEIIQILFLPILNYCTPLVPCIMWHLAAHPGLNSSGVQNIEIELVHSIYHHIPCCLSFTIPLPLKYFINPKSNGNRSA